MATNKLGRPRKLDDDKKLAILTHLASGGSRAAAAARAGVGYNTVQDELKRDPTFKELLEVAEYEGLARCESGVVDADDWRAFAWMLERKWHELYSKRSADVISYAELSKAVPILAMKLSGILTPEQNEPVERILTEWVTGLVE